MALPSAREPGSAAPPSTARLPRTRRLNRHDAACSPTALVNARMPGRVDPVLLTALVRGLVETAARAWRDGQPPAGIGTGLLRLAAWRAGCSGPDGPLIDPGTMRETSPAGAVEALYAHVREALVDHGDDERVRAGVRKVSALPRLNGRIPATSVDTGSPRR